MLTTIEIRDTVTGDVYQYSIYNVVTRKISGVYDTAQEAEAAIRMLTDAALAEERQ